MAQRPSASDPNSGPATSRIASTLCIAALMALPGSMAMAAPALSGDAETGPSAAIFRLALDVRAPETVPAANSPRLAPAGEDDRPDGDRTGS